MSSVGATGDSTYADLGLAVKTQTATKKTLGQEDFLKLMTTQLQYQDPFKPMDNGEFLGQMAQFSTVSSIQSLQSSFAQLAVWTCCVFAVDRALRFAMWAIVLVVAPARAANMP